MLIQVTLALAFVLMPLFATAYAQTVSIINQFETTPSLLVETSLKRNLRAEGYTVKSGTNEGVVIILSVMEPRNRAGATLGVVGHVTIAAIGWQDLADLAVSDPCKREHALAQKIKDYLGARLIYLDENMAVSSESESLGEMLATYSIKVIRPTFRKMDEFFTEIDRLSKQPSTDVLNPVR
jgi:hypothetical protein